MWIINLEKKGCKKIIKDGDNGVVKEMVLRFGDLSFSKKNIELNIKKKYINRD
jgi:hypothetical protein